jgi:hypothetical protein
MVGSATFPTLLGLARPHLPGGTEGVPDLEKPSQAPRAVSIFGWTETLHNFNAARRPSESYSDVILRLAEAEAD